jgi:hypothetical protein
MSNISNINESEANNGLSVILSQQKFAEMILNFLGKKEKLTYQVDKTSFFIRLNDLEQFFYLLEAKTSKEQGVYLDHFLVSISYNDGTKREIAGIEALNRFNETRDVLPIDVTMTWNIVIKYPNAETIENQKIELSFINDINQKDNSKIILIIHHTNQAWGVEVLNLFKDKIRQLIIKQSKKYITSKRIISLLNTLSSSLFPTVAVFLAIASTVSKEDFDSDYYYNLIPSYTSEKDSSDKEISLYSIQHLNSNDIRRSANTVIKSSKIKGDLLKIADSKDSMKWHAFKKFLFSLFSIFCPILVFYFYFRKACLFYFVPSFILINRRSESDYQEYKNNKRNIEFYSITFISFSIFTGVIVNYIYQVITS